MNRLLRPRDWEDFGTSEVSDALDRAGIEGQIDGVRALAAPRIVGTAFTVRYGLTGQDGGTVGDYIDDVPPGAVVVLDNAARTDVTVWGDLLTLTAHHRGVAGTVIDGVCRDTDRALAVQYPIYARGNWMRTGKDRVRVDEIQGPVHCGGVRIEPGDLIVGDSDGVVVVPADRATEMHEHARAIADAEEAIRARIESGTNLRSARQAVDYHALQSRR